MASTLEWLGLIALTVLAVAAVRLIVRVLRLARGEPWNPRDQHSFGCRHNGRLRPGELYCDLCGAFSKAEIDRLADRLRSTE